MIKYIKEFLSVFIASLLIIILLQVFAIKNVERTNSGLKDDIKHLESRIEYYENIEDWFEDYIELIGEIWQQEVEVAVLEERIYWLNKYKENSDFNKEYADQMFSDFEVLIGTMFDYVKVNGNLDNFDEYFLNNYSEVYNRIVNIYDENH